MRPPSPCSSGVDAHVEDQRQTDRVTYTLTRTGLRRCRGPRRATPHASPRYLAADDVTIKAYSTHLSALSFD